jgi:hypothetical protein
VYPRAQSLVFAPIRTVEEITIEGTRFVAAK